MKINRMSEFATSCLLFAALDAVPAGAQSGPPDRPIPPVPPPAVDTSPAQTVEGTVDGFNRDPAGHFNSVVIKTTDGKLDQFNFPPDLGDAAIHIASDGQKVTVVGSPERAVGDRTIFRLSKLTGADGRSSVTAPVPGVPQPTETIEGTVRRLNFSGHGEVDGATLDSGDFIHTGVEAGAGLMVGGKLSVTGIARPTADGHRAIEAETVDGRRVPRPPVHPDFGPRPKVEADGVTPPPPPAPDGAAPKPPVPPAADR
jgi:hypothetical protein